MPKLDAVLLSALVIGLLIEVALLLGDAFRALVHTITAGLAVAGG